MRPLLLASLLACLAPLAGCARSIAEIAGRLNVRPRLSANRHPRGTWGHTEPPRNVGPRRPHSTHSPQLHNGNRVELGTRIVFAAVGAMLARVATILGVRSPREIARSVVQLVAVQMSRNPAADRSWPMKRLGYKRMNCGGPSAGKANHSVAVHADISLDALQRVMRGALVLYGAVYAAIGPGRVSGFLGYGSQFEHGAHNSKKNAQKQWAAAAAAASVIFVGGCSQSVAVTAKPVTAAVRPVLISKDDVLTEGTASQIEANNLALKRLRAK